MEGAPRVDSTLSLKVALVPSDPAKPLRTLTLTTLGHGLPLMANLPEILKRHLNTGPGDIFAVPLRRLDSDRSSIQAYAFSPLDGFAKQVPNVRATALAFSCGLHSTRFYGDVVVSRFDEKAPADFAHGEIALRPDLRGDGGDVPDWQAGAAKVNYSYKSEITRLNSAFSGVAFDDDKYKEEEEEEDEQDEDDEQEEERNNSDCM